MTKEADSNAGPHDTYCGGMIGRMLVKHLRRRAIWSYLFSIVSLLLIVCSIGWGLYVITTAGTITNLEGKQRRQEQRDLLTDQIDKLKFESQTIAKMKNDLLIVNSNLELIQPNTFIPDPPSPPRAPCDPPAEEKPKPENDAFEGTLVGEIEKNFIKVTEVVNGAQLLNEPEIEKVLYFPLENKSMIRLGRGYSSFTWPELSRYLQSEFIAATNSENNFQIIGKTEM